MLRLTRHGERLALVGSWPLTYAELAARVQALAAGLAAHAGVRAGDRVAVLAGNCPEYVELLLACARLGAVAVPLDPDQPPPQRAARLLASGARVLFAGPEYARLVPQTTHGTAVVQTLRLGPGGESEALLEAAAPPLPEIAGGPCLLGAAALYTTAELVRAAAYGARRLRAADVGLSLVPLWQPGALALLLLPALWRGATLLLPRYFSADEAVRRIDADSVTALAATREQHEALTASPAWAGAALPQLRLAVCAGAMPAQARQAYRERGIAALSRRSAL